MGSSILAVALAMIAGVLAGRAWAAALRRSTRFDRPYRRSPHFTQGLYYLAASQPDLALSEFKKVSRQNPGAPELIQIVGNLLRESGQVERAINLHQSLLSRGDLSRRERIHALVCLGLDFQKAGFVDRASRTFAQVIELEPANVHALLGLQKLHEEQKQWREAFEVASRLARQKRCERAVLGYLQAEIGAEAAQAGDIELAEESFRQALGYDRRVFPAYLGLADLLLPREPRNAAATLEQAIKAVPERAYLAFTRLARVYSACGEPQRFVALCEHIIDQDPQDWRARLALARHLRLVGRFEEAYGLLLRAVAANPQALLVHLETWRTLQALQAPSAEVERYVSTTADAAAYVDPHLCTACRYRADDVLWRCPHCHAWGTFVDERLSLVAAR